MSAATLFMVQWIAGLVHRAQRSRDVLVKQFGCRHLPTVTARIYYLPSWRKKIRMRAVVLSLAVCAAAEMFVGLVIANAISALMPAPAPQASGRTTTVFKNPH
jgi:hypothetical protein